MAQYILYGEKILSLELLPLLKVQNTSSLHLLKPTQANIPCISARLNLGCIPTHKSSSHRTQKHFLSSLQAIALPNAAFPCYKQRDSLTGVSQTRSLVLLILYACGKFGVSLITTRLSLSLQR
jgi:hypothetical protein